MTLISSSVGGSVFRCDSKCHNATGAKCDCVCGGKYHGKREGSREFKQAMEELGQEIDDDFKGVGRDSTGLLATLDSERWLF